MSFRYAIRHFLEENGALFDWQQRWTSANYRAMQETFRKFARPNQRILDLGCAISGCVHQIWKGLEPNYTGVDMTFGYLQRGKRRYPQAALVRANIALLPFHRMPFDIVCAFSVLHHLDNATVQALGQQLSDRLPPTSRILVAEPLFPPQVSGPRSKSDALSHFLLKHDRGHFIRPAEDYISLLGHGLQTVSSFQFIYGVHHFCGFELCSRRAV